MFFADNPEIGGPGEDIAEGGGGVSEQAKEQLQEEIQKAQAQQKRDQSDEKKAKKKDNKLGDFLKQFIKDRDDRMALLIARLLEKNVPVTFILGILSLTNEEISEVLDKHLSFQEPTTSELIISKEGKLPAVFGDQAMKIIDEWGNRLFQNASTEPMRHITTLAHHGGVELTAVQLIAFTVDNFLQDQKIEKEFEDIQSFSEFLLKGILHKLHDIADEQGILPEPEEKEEDDD